MSKIQTWDMGSSLGAYDDKTEAQVSAQYAVPDYRHPTAAHFGCTCGKYHKFAASDKDFEGYEDRPELYRRD